MKRFSVIGVICLGYAHAATVVVPNGLENIEGNTSAAGIGGSPPSRTQIIFGPQHFSVLQPGGGRISEMSFRVDGPNGFSFASNVDLEVHLSTSKQNPDQLSFNLFENVGMDDLTVIPRTTVRMESGMVGNGVNAFSLVLPLPTQFNYDPNQGSLLLDMFIYSISGPFANLDWQGGAGDGVSSATAPLVPGTTIVSAGGLVTRFRFEPVPEPSSFALSILGLALAFKRRLNVTS